MSPAGEKFFKTCSPGILNPVYEAENYLQIRQHVWNPEVLLKAGLQANGHFLDLCELSSFVLLLLFLKPKRGTLDKRNREDKNKLEKECLSTMGTKWNH